VFIVTISAKNFQNLLTANKVDAKNKGSSSCCEYIR